MFVRHPPERVLSAYRNKIEHPLITNPAEQSIWDDVRHIILSSYRMKFNKKLAKQEEIFPSFSEFIHFLYDSDPALMNEHYKPMVELCQPCAIKYNYIGNFATLRRDANNILSYLNINSSLFWDRGKHKSNPTISHVQQYYSKLQAIDFRRLEERFAEDIGFYNHLFPHEYDGEYSELRKLLWRGGAAVCLTFDMLVTQCYIQIPIPASKHGHIDHELWLAHMHCQYPLRALCYQNTAWGWPCDQPVNDARYIHSYTHNFQSMIMTLKLYKVENVRFRTELQPRFTHNPISIHHVIV